MEGEPKVLLATKWIFTLYPEVSEAWESPKDRPKAGWGPEQVLQKLKWEGATAARINWERCPTTARLHYQGVVSFKQRKRNATLQNKLWKGFWEKCMDWEVQWDYCGKPESRVDPDFGPWEFGKAPVRVYRTGLETQVASGTLASWQVELFKMLEETPEADRPKRSIFWFWSVAPKRGKSSTFAHLEDHMGCVGTEMINDTQRMLYSIAGEVDPARVKATCEAKEGYPAICIDIPRHMPCDYSVLETLCNERFSNQFQRPCRVRLYPCFKIVFANYPPNCDPDVISQDRFVVTCVD